MLSHAKCPGVVAIFLKGQSAPERSDDGLSMVSVLNLTQQVMLEVSVTCKVFLLRLVKVCNNYIISLSFNCRGVGRYFSKPSTMDALIEGGGIKHSVLCGKTKTGSPFDLTFCQSVLESLWRENGNGKDQKASTILFLGFVCPGSLRQVLLLRLCVC